MDESDNLKIYMDTIQPFPLLNREEETQLAQKALAGDKEAQEQLINSNLRLVVKIAHDFKGRGLPLIDLISEGNLGLIKAVGMFDPSKGAKLSTYASWWIKQYMQHAILNQVRIVRVPPQNHTKALQVQYAKRKLEAELGREPTVNEIAESLKLTPRVVQNAQQGMTTTIYLDAEIQPGEDSVFSDIIPDTTGDAPDNTVINQELYDLLRNLADSLDERERTIINMRFGLDGNPPMTLDEVSQSIGRTRERVRQLQNSALNKLRKSLSE